MFLGQSIRSVDQSKHGLDKYFKDNGRMLCFASLHASQRYILQVQVQNTAEMGLIV